MSDEKEIKLYLDPMIKALKMEGIRIQVDWTNNTPGYKFNEWEMKGVPLRMEVGPRDIQNNKVVLVRRDLGEKIFLSKQDVLSNVPQLLEKIQNNLLNQAKEFRDVNTHFVSTYNEFRSLMKTGGFVRCGWDGSSKTELKIKEETKATIRCIPFDEKPEGLRCVLSGKPAKHEVIFAKAY